ncbi:MAG TPA: S-adenosylmethionine:tRNA ribosyltransferase-isomerase, partial [Bryobacteraceae bacterium]|nr:S-adenosylmethionine:tRNA ribosyltransferase-isomerase [Bryobacteraceae bacterium]
MLVSEFDYELPEELIAQTPPAERGSSRMLVISRAKQTFEDRMFADFPQYVGPGDCIALNNTRVFPARLHGYRNHAAGASVEVFLIRAKPPDETVWTALVKPAKRVRSGDTILFDSSLRADVIAEGGYGERALQFHAAEPLSEVFERLGSTPLPPYIH